MKALKYIVLFLCGCFFSCKKEIRADTLIRNGLIYNGIDTIPSNLSVVIKHDKIIYIGNETAVELTAEKIIDATGLIVSPGFIDPHTHADRDLVVPERAHNLPFLMQGITTVITGNDGNSFYPSAKYQELYKKQGIGTNVVQLVGHHEILKEVIGNSDVEPTAADIEKMQSLMQKEMDAGIFGMSTGLYYAPGSYTSTEEVIALAKVVGENGGVYDTHLRDESSNTIGVIAAIEEAIQIGRTAKIPIHISHIKCLGVDVWNKSDSIIQIIETARKNGIEVSANQYPYSASGTSLNAAVSPRWAESGGRDSLLYRASLPELKTQIFKETKANINRRGGANKLLIVKCNDSIFLGKTLQKISEMLEMSPQESVYEILKSGYVRVASFNMNNNDIHKFMKQDWVVTGSDGNTGHPRKFGTFPRKFNKYTKLDKVISMSTFINGSTSKTAAIFRIEKRGQLKVGYYADVIVFNPKTFKDIADFKNSFQYSKGLEYCIVNGKISVEKGKYNKALNGRVLKKNHE